MVNCTDLEPLISAYVDDELWPAQREMIALHLERCQTCQTYMIAHQRARRLLTSSAYPGKVPDLRAAVHARLASDRHIGLARHTNVHLLHHGSRRIAGAGRLVLIALCCFLAGRMSALPSSPQAAGPVALNSGLSSCALARPSPSPTSRVDRPPFTPSVSPSANHVIMVLPCPASTSAGEVMVVDGLLSVSPGATPSSLTIRKCRNVQCVQQAVRVAIVSGIQDGTLPVTPANDVVLQPRARRGLPQML